MIFTLSDRKIDGERLMPPRT